MTAFDILDFGITTVKLISTGEIFDIKAPKVNLHNYILGKPYVWYSGRMTTINKITGMNV